MRILILVLSYNQHPYNGFMQAQKETWDKELNENVSVLYYTGKEISGRLLTGDLINDIQSPECSDEYYQMHWKFKQCLDKCCAHNYDFIFRTNSSSYINKKMLLKFAEKLPKEKCFAGCSLGEKEAVSGAGIWLSPDMVEILREELPPGENIEEDILIGRILHKKHGIDIIDDKSRFDVTAENVDHAPTHLYHYRFKTGDRLDDIRNFYKMHQRINK